jgi:hypothetical protein
VTDFAALSSGSLRAGGVSIWGLWLEAAPCSIAPLSSRALGSSPLNYLCVGRVHPHGKMVEDRLEFTVPALFGDIAPGGAVAPGGANRS